MKGRKRFLLVDTLGLVMKVLVTEADVGERAGAEWLLTSLGDRFLRLKLVWADGGFDGQDFIERIRAKCNLKLEIIKRSDEGKGFVPLPRRWDWDSAARDRYGWR